MASGPGFPGPDHTRSRRRARLQRRVRVRSLRRAPASPVVAGSGPVGQRPSSRVHWLRMCEGRREARPPTRAASSCPIMILSRISGTLASARRCANKSTPSAWPERTQLCNCESSVKRTAAKGRNADAGMAGQAQAGQTSQGLFPPGREPNSRSGAVTTVTLAIQVAAQIGGSARGYQELSSPLAIPTTAG